MSQLKEVYHLIKQEGMSTGISKIINHGINILFDPIRGGKSSRSRVQLISKIFHPFYNYYFNYKYSPGEDIFEKDWDNLIILDACRYDDFEKLNTLEGELRTHMSNSVDSKEFIEKNFLGNEHHDVVYITANPHVREIGEGIFHDLITDPLEKWDENLQCVKPEHVTESAISASKKYPNKRLIIHYMQPHDPPIGKTAEEIKSEINISGPSHKNGQQNGKRVMSSVAEGKISEQWARKAYRETLDIVLSDVERLLPELHGKTIITADHGEMFGEQPYPIIGKLYEHFNHPRTLELCKVPWFILNYENRKEVYSEPPESLNPTHSQPKNVEDQLEALGYK